MKMNRKYDLDAPLGVAGRNSDNSFIKQVLKWEPSTSLNRGLAETFAWIKTQIEARKAGKRVGVV
jgi:nucleoside-diphosphate-sugar epimerase